jgi:hypothetical protein
MEFFGRERSPHERPRRPGTAAHPDQLLKMGVTTVYSSLRSIWKKTGFTPTFMSQTVQHGISLMLIMRHGHRRTLTHRCPAGLAA